MPHRGSCDAQWWAVNYADREPRPRGAILERCSDWCSASSVLLKESDDGRTFVVLELPRDLEELLAQRTDRAVDDGPPATGGLKQGSGEERNRIWR